jgi:hypothetical protein
MKFVLAGTSALVVALAAGAAAQDSGPRRDGNREVTMEMQMPNMPNMPTGFSMPPMKTTQCITPADAADPTRAMPPRGERGRAGECKVSDYKAVGNKVTWNMVCTGAEPMSGTGEFIYNTDSYTGTMVMNMARGGQGMAMTMKYTGKRLGDCTK